MLIVSYVYVLYFLHTIKDLNMIVLNETTQIKRQRPMKMPECTSMSE